MKLIIQAELYQYVNAVYEMVRPTFILNGKTRHSKGGVTTECQEKTVPAALDALGGLTSLETANQATVGVLALVDVQKVIAGLHVEAAR